MTSPNTLYTEREAAQRLAISIKTLRRWRWQRRGVPFVKIGAAVRYSGADLDAFVAAGRVETDAPQAA